MTTLQSPPSPPRATPAPPQSPPDGPGAKRRRKGALPLAAAIALVVGAAGGLAIGHVAWPHAPTFEAAPAPLATPAGTGASGGLGTDNGDLGSGGSGDGSADNGDTGGNNTNNGESNSDSPDNGNSGGSSGLNGIPPFLIPLLPGGLGSGSATQQSGTITSAPGTITSAPGAPPNISAIAAKVDKAVVDIDDLFSYQQAAGAGTGIVLSSDGLVLTNNHVIDGATTIQATDRGNGKTYTATVVGYNPSHDVALLQLNGASGLATATLGDSSAVKVGEPVVAIGNAEGVGGTPSAAGGSVTALNQSVEVGDDMYGTTTTLNGMIQVNADIVPGDSGGPLVTADGDVVGIDTAAAAGQQPGSSSSVTEGEVTPINTAKSVVEIIESGTGNSQVHVGPTAALGLLMSGNEVEGVIPGGASASAGLQAGDTITAVGGHRVTSGASLQGVMLSYRPGQQVRIDWVDQAGASQRASVTLGTGPAA